MPDYDLGTARGKIDIDSSGAEFGFGRAVAANEGFERSLGKTNKAAKVTGPIVAGAGLAVAAGLGLAINSAASFEERMSAIQAVSGATGKEMEQLSDLALQLGADTAFSAGEAASAIEELIKAGLPVEEVLNGAAEAAVNLAAAGEIDLKEAATIAANAMNAFNLEGKDMAHVADLIAGAANASAIDVGEFGQALQQSGATANLVGLSFDDLSVAIAAMGNAGIKGSDAGTSLKTFLSNLQPVTEKQIELFKELGLVTEDGANAFFDAQGKIKPMRDIAETLSQALAGMTDQQKALTLETLFGSDAIRAAAIIADEGAAGFDELAASMGKVSAEEVAETRLDNLRGSIEQLKGSLETLAIRIGQPLLKGIRGVVDALTGLVNWFGELSPGVQKAIGIILALVAAFLIVGGTILLLVGWLGTVAAAVGLTVGGLLAAVATAFIWVAAIAAIIAALVLLWQKNETFRNAVKATWEWIRDNVGAIIENIVNGVKGLVDAFNSGEITEGGLVGAMQAIGVAARAVVDFIVNDFVPAVQWLASEIQERLDSAFGWLQDNVFPVLEDMGNLFMAIAGVIGGVLKTIAPLFQAAWKNVITVVTGAVAIIRRIIEAFVKVVKIVWENFGSILFDHLKNIWNLIVGLVQGALDFIRGIIQIFTGILTLDWAKTWEGIKNVISGAWQGIQAVVGFTVGYIQTIIRTFLAVVKTIWQTSWEAIKATIDIIWTAIQTVVSTVVNTIKGVIETFLNVITGIWSIAWNGVKDFLYDAWTTMLNTVTGFIGSIVNFLTTFPESAKNALSGVVGKLVSRGNELIQGLLDGALATFQGLLNWITSLPEVVVEWLGDLGSTLYDAGADLIGGLIDGITDSIPSLSDVLGGITDIIPDWKGPPEKDAKLLTENGRLIMQGFMRGIQSQIKPLRSMMREIAPSLSADLQVRPGGWVGTNRSGTINNETFHMTLEFPNVGNANDARQIQGVLSDSIVLRDVVTAVKAGRRMR